MRPQKTGFTLVELLVVIGISALLISILMPAVSNARKSAQQLSSMSGLRQMMLGYAMYCQDNRGAVPFGYSPPTVNGVTITVTDKLSGMTFSSPVADRYPWRLLPYVGNIWQIIHSHTDLPALPQAGDTYSTAILKAYTLSLNPTYGINAEYVGGQTGSPYLGFVDSTGLTAGDIPNVGHHVVFKNSEVHRPSQLIVFADCHTYNVMSLVGSGLHYLTPPHAAGHNWQVKNGKIQLLNSSLIMGVPQGWITSKTVVAFFDGHVEMMLPAQLDDMRLWANWANTVDYDYVNAP